MCYQLCVEARLQLFVSSVVLEELGDVASQPKIVRKLHITSSRVTEFLESIGAIATVLDNIPVRFTYARDPDDVQDVNLALAADARLIVSRDQYLLDLARGVAPEAHKLLSEYPGFEVLTPDELLAKFDTPR